MTRATNINLKNLLVTLHNSYFLKVAVTLSSRQICIIRILCYELSQSNENVSFTSLHTSCICCCAFEPLLIFGMSSNDFTIGCESVQFWKGGYLQPENQKKKTVQISLIFSLSLHSLRLYQNRLTFFFVVQHLHIPYALKCRCVYWYHFLLLSATLKSLPQTVHEVKPSPFRDFRMNLNLLHYELSNFT